jgi:membrane-associated phospholipid phosphatase
MDRSVTSNWSPKAATASDVLLIATASLPFVIDLVDVMADPESDGFSGWAKDALVMLEALTVSFSVTQVYKIAVERPRPFTYNPNAPLKAKLQYDAAQSFFSGHASTAFCAAAAFSMTFHRRHPRSPSRYVVWVGSFSLAATTALLRERAGKHYWTDLLVGAAVGTLVGIGVPWLHFDHHDEAAGVDLSVTPVGVSGRF